MGIVKIYNVLGGFYENYNTTVLSISVHKVAKICEIILCKMRKRLHSAYSVVSSHHTTIHFLQEMLLTAFPAYSEQSTL